MSITVTKEFSFDCSHMLSNHLGLCSNVHGHTYKLQVGLMGSTIKATEDSEPEETSEHGMLMDFKVLKEIVKENIVDKFDHAFITWADGNEQEKKVAETLRSLDMKVLELPERTTAENMGQWMFNELQRRHFGVGVELCYIRLYETPTSYVEVFN